MRIRRAWTAAGVVALLLSGCTGGSSTPAASTTTLGPSTTTSAGAGTTVVPTTAVGTPTSTPTSTAAATAASCPTGALGIAVSDLSAAAGTDFKALSFHNDSSEACTLFGYPGVSFVDASGRQIGAAVPRATGTDTLVTLAPGMNADALLAYHDVYVSTTANCQPTPAAGIRVYPPNQKASVIVAVSLMVCGNAATPGSAAISPVTTAAGLQP